MCNYDNGHCQSRASYAQLQAEMELVYPQVLSALSSNPTVLQVGLGARERKGRLTGELCFRVYVREKHRKAKVKASDLVPREFFGFKTDVHKLHPSQLHAIDNSLERPLKGGIMIKNHTKKTADIVGAGTLGCIVKLHPSNQLMALTCLHVVSDGKASPTTATGYGVGQPCVSTVCCCCTGQEIGTVHTVNSTLDVALIALNGEMTAGLSTDTLINTIKTVGVITGAQEAVCFDTVEKYGAGSSHTTGVIVDVRYQGDKILIEPTGDVFSSPGDSGAVVVHSGTKKVVGVMIGGLVGAEEVGVAQHIGPVMTALNIKIANQTVGSLGIPAASCGSAPAGRIQTVKDFWDKYDRTAMPPLVPSNTTDFTTQTERDDRVAAVGNAITILQPLWDSRRINAGSNATISSTILPWHTGGSLTSGQQLDNDKFVDIEELAVYQVNLYKQFFPDGSGGINYKLLREAYELFVNGEVRNFPHPILGPTASGHREPDGAFELMFAEFAFLCIENATNPNKPTNLLDADVWLKCARIFVEGQEIYFHTYRPGTQAAATPVLPLGKGLYQTTTPIRNYNNYHFRNWNLNNSNGVDDTYLGATTAIGQSDIVRKLQLRSKYAKLTYTELKEAMKENIQEMICQP